ncbi:unnamed protein product [[Candida] boidinii]|nr:unnamed protein product [[Candida] boidinii]
MKDSSGDSSESEPQSTTSSSLRRSPSSISVDSNFSNNSWVNLKQNQSGSSATASGSGNSDLNETSILNRIRKNVIERNKEEGKEQDTLADDDNDVEDD